MITSALLGAFLVTVLVVMTLCFIEYALFQNVKDCEHKAQVTYDSYHKKICIDCGQEFSTVGIKK